MPYRSCMARALTDWNFLSTCRHSLRLPPYILPRRPRTNDSHSFTHFHFPFSRSLFFFSLFRKTSGKQGIQGIAISNADEIRRHEKWTWFASIPCKRIQFFSEQAIPGQHNCARHPLRLAPEDLRAFPATRCCVSNAFERPRIYRLQLRHTLTIIAMIIVSYEDLPWNHPPPHIQEILLKFWKGSEYSSRTFYAPADFSAMSAEIIPHWNSGIIKVPPILYTVFIQG